MNINQKRLITRLYKLKSYYSKDLITSRALMYHSVKSPRSKEEDSLWVVNSDLFLSHMKYLKSVPRCNIVPSSSLNNIKNSSCIAITFDDGHKDTYDIAAPILLDMNIPFTVFVITNFVKSGMRGYMSEKMLRDLDANPLVTIGSHSMNHYDLSVISDQSLQEEIASSKKYLEDLLGKKIDYFSYPYGKYNLSAKKAVQKAGYIMAFSSHFDKNYKAEDKFCKNRTEVWNNDNLEQFKDKIEGHWDWLKYRSL